MHVVWTGERVRLRPFNDKEEHAGTLEEMSLQEDRFWGYGWWTRGRLNADFDQHGEIGEPGRHAVFALERLDTGEVAGYEVARVPLPGEISTVIGTSVLRRHWNHGFGREAKQLAMCFVFENFPVEVVAAETMAAHGRAVRGLEMCKMTCDGRSRCEVFSQGHWSDVVIYSIFREEWEQLPVRQTVKRGMPCT